MKGILESGGARIMDSNGIVLNRPDLMARFSKIFVYRLNCELFPVLFENLVTVGTGNIDFPNTIVDKVGLHFSEHRIEEIFSPQIVRRLGATIKNDAQRRNFLLHKTVQRQDFIRAGSCKRTTGEQYGIATDRQSIPGIALRSSRSLILEKSAVFGEISVTVAECISPHFQKHIGRIEVFRTDGGT